MYIAFKWLVFLVFTMWLAMCVVDIFLKGSMKIRNAGVEFIFTNKSVEIELSDTTQGTIHESYHEKVQNIAGLHFIMFIAGALAVTAFHKKEEIITFTHRNMAMFNRSDCIRKILFYSKKTATEFRVTISKCLLYCWGKINMLSFKIINRINRLKISRSVKQNKIHIILLNKLKQIGEERKNLGQLLISAIHENKNIRMRYELETMTKNRLMQHIEDTQKEIRENRSRYVSFQQLYLVTHQENTFLKARLGKLKQEKDENEKNLMALINEVYRSNNKELKAFCGRFIVKTKEKVLNSDVSAEIQEFLENTRIPSEARPSTHFFRQSETKVEESANSWPSATSIRITEILNEDDSLVPLVSDAPRLKGLPGEYIWTVKDKDGIIEKLYEYDYESDLDNGDTIRRIRQYSVYFDKDCLLDFTKVESEVSIETPSIVNLSLDNPLNNQKFVTGSEAFQNFLKSSTSIVHKKPSASPLLCG